MPTMLLGAWEWGRGDKKQTSDSGPHELTRSRLRGMTFHSLSDHTQDSAGPAGPVSASFIPGMTQPSFWLNACGSGERHRGVTSETTRQPSLLSFLPPASSPSPLNLPTPFPHFPRPCMSHLRAPGPGGGSAVCY